MENKKVSVAILFTNYTERDFSWSWDGVRYDFPAKADRMMEDYLANHFAKHLAIRELNRKGLPASKGNIELYKKKALASDVTVEAPDATSLRSEVLDYGSKSRKELAEEAKEKGIKVGNKKKADLQSELEAFEGLEKE